MALRTENLIATVLLELDERSVARVRAAKNQASKPIEAEVEFSVDENSVRGLERQINKIADQLSGLSPDDDLFDPLSKDLVGLQKQLDGTIKKISQAGGASSDATKKIGGLGKGLANLGVFAAGIGIADVLSGIVSGSVDAAAAFETTQASFEVLLGSTAEATRLLEELDLFSVTSPFEPTEVQASAKTLLSFGRTATQVEEDIRLIGEASAATGADLQSLSIVFGQVAAVNKLQGGDALQFINQGIPVYDLLSKRLEVSVGEVKKLQEEGKITFDILRGAFEDAAAEGGKFSGALLKQSETLSGLRSTLAGVREAILRAFGERLLDSVKAATSAAIEFGKSLLGVIQVPVSEKLKEEQKELNTLVTSLTLANTSEEERSRIIATIDEQYPSFLRNKSLEVATERELREALVQANKEYEARIVLQQLGEAVAKQQEQVDKETTRRSRNLIRFAGALASAQRALGTELESFDDAIDQFNAQGVTERDIINGGSEFVGNTNAITEARERLVTANNALTVSDRRLLREINELSEAQGEQAEQTDVLRKAFPELFAELEKIRKGADDIAKSPGGATGIDPDKVLAQAGSVAAIQKQISELQKTINTAAATAPEQLGYATELDALKIELINAKALLDSLLDVRSLPAISIPVSIDFQGRVDPLQENTSELEAALERDLRIQELAQKRAELQAVGNEDELTKIRLDGLKERRQILLDSSVADAGQFIGLAIEIAEAEFSLEEAKTEKARDEADKRKELARETKDVLLGFADEIVARQIERANNEIKIQEQRLDAILGIADRGNAEQVQLEESRLQKLTEEREKYVRQQRQIAAAQIAIENAVAVAGAVRLIATSTNPVDIALRSILVAATIASTISTLSGAFSDVPSFYKGTESVQGATTKGQLIEVHGKERVLTAADNAPLLKMGVRNDQIPGLVEMGLMMQGARISKDLITPIPVNNNKDIKDQNTAILKELKRNRVALSNLKITQSIDSRGVRQMVDSEGRVLDRRKKLRR